MTERAKRRIALLGMLALSYCCHTGLFWKFSACLPASRMVMKTKIIRIKPTTTIVENDGMCEKKNKRKTTQIDKKLKFGDL